MSLTYPPCWIRNNLNRCSIEKIRERCLLAVSNSIFLERSLFAIQGRKSGRKKISFKQGVVTGVIFYGYLKIKM